MGVDDMKLHPISDNSAILDIGIVSGDTYELEYIYESLYLHQNRYDCDGNTSKYHVTVCITPEDFEQLFNMK